MGQEDIDRVDIRSVEQLFVGVVDIDLVSQQRPNPLPLCSYRLGHGRDRAAIHHFAKTGGVGAEDAAAAQNSDPYLFVHLPSPSLSLEC